MEQQHYLYGTGTRQKRRGTFVATRVNLAVSFKFIQLFMSLGS